ncbi:RNA polymerase subunit sigma-24 [Micromonospora sp. WMMA2032]|uniref:RNA polymerase sigma factor n=1 Tax=Micromonospora sp. WMMA2032 TaxID=2039870 RepID=UPI000C058C95|nr:sigma-70 family RNA polymerase sigma factor [Micromonospora sp. WMMA2032]ATO14666.1 RNA polymerase subunit sigma-24 [Micromonospora sp. WMMA2032]
MTPQELVLAAQAGNHDAFVELWRLYRDDVMRCVYRRTTDRWLTEDITSEVFLRAWRRLPDFTWRDKGFGGWLITIAGNLVADHYKSAHRRHSAYFPIDNDDDWPVPSTDRWDDPHEAFQHARLAAALDRALAKLTPEQRTVVALRFGAGLPHVEAGALMGRNADSAKQLQYRAVRALKTDPDLAAVAA